MLFFEGEISNKYAPDIGIENFKKVTNKVTKTCRTSTIMMLKERNYNIEKSEPKIIERTILADEIVKPLQSSA